MNITWAKNPQVTFTGRNGNGFCCGLDVLLLNYPNIAAPRVVIAPITSKGNLGRCDIDIPIQHVDEVITLLQIAKENYEKNRS